MKRRRDLSPESFGSYDSVMLQIDSDASFDAQSSSRAPKKRRARNRSDAAENPQILLNIRPLPLWARAAGVARGDAASAAFFAGIGLAHLDLVLRAGEDDAEPVFSGALRQRLALKAAASCARLARLREDEAALRDAEHLISSCRRASIAKPLPPFCRRRRCMKIRLALRRA